MRWGTHAVEEAIRAGRARRVLLQADAASRTRLSALAELAREAGATIEFVPADVLDARVGPARHQGAVAEVRPFHYVTLEELLAGDRGEPPYLLLLDGIEDPQNLGTILRSADAAGVHGVVLPERRAAPVSPAVARASAGAVDHVAVARVVNLVRTIETLKAAGVWVYGLDPAGAEAFDTADYARPVALVAGAEGTGLSRLVRERCDVLLSIPMQGHVASLNVAVATSLALFAARRARDRALARPS
ncbi:MAG: 23S rRNA (guanosine(2251)-2'-O)-methyltransferase RlmB [Chloroflexota bacterium]